MSEESGTPNEGEQQQQEQTFTQADIDRIVKERVKRERERFADYDDLKAKAEGAKTATERLAALEAKLAEADAREQRRQLVESVAAKHGITDPDDVQLFLTGADEDTLTAQAERLAARQGEQRRKGNYVPNEGRTTTNTGDADVRAFARQLFDSKE